MHACVQYMPGKMLKQMPENTILENYWKLMCTDNRTIDMRAYLLFNNISSFLDGWMLFLFWHRLADGDTNARGSKSCVHGHSRWCYCCCCYNHAVSAVYFFTASLKCIYKNVYPHLFVYLSIYLFIYSI